MASVIDQFDHPAWVSIVGMGISYLVLLVGITVVLFLFPYLVFLGL